MGGVTRSAVTAAILTGSVFAAVVFTDEPLSRSTASVCIDIRDADYVPGSASNGMRVEATRIWARQRVALSWSKPVPANCDDVVPIVFDNDKLRKIAGARRDDALALTVFSGRSRIVYVSVTRVFQLVAQLRQSTPQIVSDGERDIRGGMLLGRVVAHELGHVLLTTTAHSISGLMRPIYGTGDVLSADESTTALSSSEQSRLAVRFSLMPDAPTVLARQER
jgi:hypothetical protein